MVGIEVSFLYFVLVVMALVILLTNVLIRKGEMMKVTQKENTHIKEKELQRKILRIDYASKKTYHHQMKMKSVTVRHEEFYSWK
jgi:Flp pilus assembly protein TadB